VKVIDISGRIYKGMWNYGDQYPNFNLTSVGFPYGGEVYPVDVFEGMHAQTGTYIESPGIYLEGEGRKLNDIPIEKFYRIDTYILKIDHNELGIKDNRPYISVDDVKKAEKGSIPPDSAILVGTGYGKNWDKKDYIERSWFFQREALYYLIDKHPFLIGGDSPVWENDVHPEGAFERFYREGIYLLAPCIKLEEIESYRVKLIVLPINVTEANICPVRAVVVEE
jgi:kynurenine formamidase